MKRKWWLLGGCAVLLSLLVSLCFFGVRLRIAPRLVLSRALNATFEQLEERFDDSPVHLIEEAMDREGRQSASLQLQTEQDLLGIIRYDMHLHTQLRPNRIQAEGSVIAGGKALDLALYLDDTFAAVSSKSLVEGSYYGITYDTFSENIRSLQLLNALIGEKTISGWEDSVSALDEAMSRDLTMPEWETEDVVSALYGILALEPRVSRIDAPAGGAVKTDAVMFRATGQEIAKLVEPHRAEVAPELLRVIDEWKADASACVEAVFLLQKGKLMQIQLDLVSSASTVRMTACPGNTPATEPMTLEIVTQTGEDRSRLSLKVETVSYEAAYQERLDITQTRNGLQHALSLDYSYDLSTGEMDLTILRDGNKAQLRLNLEGGEDSLTIRSQDVSPLLNLFLKMPMESPAICTLTVSPGREVAVPEYRDLKQWSMEDLFALLTGFGGLLGLEIP